MDYVSFLVRTAMATREAKRRGRQRSRSRSIDAVFLASEDSDFVTGIVLFADGGISQVLGRNRSCKRSQKLVSTLCLRRRIAYFSSLTTNPSSWQTSTVTTPHS